MPPPIEHPRGGGASDEQGEPGRPTQEEVDRRFAELMSDPDLKSLQLPSREAGPPIEFLPKLEPPQSEPSPPELQHGAAASSTPSEAETETASTLGGPRDYAPPDELDEGFQPEEPEPLGTADPIRLLAWTGAIAGPILLLLAVLAWPSAPLLVWLSLVAATLVGWGVAFARLPRSRDDDDDGAVV